MSALPFVEVPVPEVTAPDAEIDGVLIAPATTAPVRTSPTNTPDQPAHDLASRAPAKRAGACPIRVARLGAARSWPGRCVDHQHQARAGLIHGGPAPAPSSRRTPIRCRRSADRSPTKGHRRHWRPGRSRWAWLRRRIRSSSDQRTARCSAPRRRPGVRHHHRPRSRPRRRRHRRRQARAPRRPHRARRPHRVLAVARSGSPSATSSASDQRVRVASRVTISEGQSVGFGQAEC